MSTKSQLAFLRERQAELKKLIEVNSAQLATEEAQQTSISNAVEQYDKRKSKLSIELYQTYSKKLESQNQKVDEIRTTVDAYQKEYSSNTEKISEYLNNTSFYINEQISYLVEEFLKYVVEHELELGVCITTNFAIVACTKKCGESRDTSGVDIPTGNFFVKKITRDKESDVITQTKDYYFEESTANTYYDGYWECVRAKMEDWYKQYEEAFLKLLLRNSRKNLALIILN